MFYASIQQNVYAISQCDNKVFLNLNLN